ncbi:hypothetical protein BGW80DRAFT_1401917 [Lactifluus volemus]|nr:hypothetical protein BGW80DRAFT_1401917 [Lactifluus volemus]
MDLPRSHIELHGSIVAVIRAINKHTVALISLRTFHCDGRLPASNVRYLVGLILPTSGQRRSIFFK